MKYIDIPKDHKIYGDAVTLTLKKCSITESPTISWWSEILAPLTIYKKYNFKLDLSFDISGLLLSKSLMIWPVKYTNNSWKAINPANLSSWTSISKTTPETGTSSSYEHSYSIDTMAEMDAAWNVKKATEEKVSLAVYIANTTEEKNDFDSTTKKIDELEYTAYVITNLTEQKTLNKVIEVKKEGYKPKVSLTIHQTKIDDTIIENNNKVILNPNKEYKLNYNVTWQNFYSTQHNFIPYFYDKNFETHEKFNEILQGTELTCEFFPIPSRMPSDKLQELRGKNMEHTNVYVKDGDEDVEASNTLSFSAQINSKPNIENLTINKTGDTATAFTATITDNDFSFFNVCELEKDILHKITLRYWTDADHDKKTGYTQQHAWDTNQITETISGISVPAGDTLYVQISDGIEDGNTKSVYNPLPTPKYKQVKVYDNGTWKVQKAIKVYNGTNWVAAKAVKVYDGSEWKNVKEKE